MKRRLLSIFLSLTMILSMVPSVWAADETQQDDTAAQETETPAKPEKSDNCGATANDTVTWKLEKNSDDLYRKVDEDGTISYTVSAEEGYEKIDTYTLTISGSGDMADYYALNVQRPADFDGDIAPWRRALLSDPEADRTTDELVPITKVEIGDGVTRIGSGAFAYTTLTGTVTFNENVHSYGDGVFARDALIQAVDWTNFKPTVKIKDGWVKSYTEEHIAVPYAFFDGCSSLATSIIDGEEYSGELVLPDNVDAIYVAAFRGTGFSTADFSDGLANIKTVGSYAISGLENMNEFFYPGDVDFYGMDDEGRNNVIKGGGIKKLTIAKEVTELPAYFCTGTENLTVIEFESGSQLKKIGKMAFYGTQALKSIDIPSTVTSIGESAFADCFSLEKIELGQIEFLGQNTFARCSSLETAKIQGSSDVTYPSNMFSTWGTGHSAAPLKTLEIGAGKIQISLYGQKDSIETIVLGDGVTEIPANFAAYCTELTSVSLPDALTSVPANAFDGCSKLEEVGISENSKLQSIGSNAFRNSALTQIYIPKNVTSIGGSAFNKTPITVFDMSDVLAESMEVGDYAINNWYASNEKKPDWKDNFKYIYVSNSGAAASVKAKTGSCNYAFVVTNGGTVDSSKTGLAAVSKAGYSVTWTSSNGTRVAAPETATLISGETYTAAWTLANGNVEITYDPNIPGGNDKNVVRVAVKNSATDVARELFSRTGYTFTGWNTKADGTGTAYKTGDTIKADTMTLYAQWTLDKPTISGTTTAVYGNEVTLTAKTAVTGASYQWCKDGAAIAGKTTDSLTLTNVADSGAYTVKITVGSDTARSEPTTVTITKATPDIKISADQTSLTGSGTVKLTVSGVPAEGKVEVTCNNGITVTKNEGGTFSAALPNESKTYTFTASYTGAENGNYSDKDAKCTVTVTRRSSGSGSNYAVSAPSSVKNGTVTVSPKSASKGSTVTVTVKPDSGYVLETLTVVDQNGSKIKLTDKGDGKYTFTMPSGKVEVKAAFMEDNSVLNFFYDVPNDAYYYEAVKWAVDKGITGGVGDNLFGAEQPCTRSQIVTFLWRAAGSPEPKSASSFADVSADSYYAKAVAWAVENGITTGTGADKFSPDAVCTRAQAVTFLARALNGKAAGGAEFTDVPADSYFADAVAWALSNGVTGGIGDGLFGADNDCTRAQIVTFLFRAYNK